MPWWSTREPAADADEDRLDPANHPNLHAYLSAQAGLWFGEPTVLGRSGAGL
jgi:hypothetical protein